jgi:hypothetical protein
MDDHAHTDAAGLLRRADRHLARAAAAPDDEAALAAAWLASRYSVLAVLRAAGRDLDDTSGATVAASARDLLPGPAAAAVAALEDAVARDDASDPSACVARARRIRRAAGEHLARRMR